MKMLRYMKLVQCGSCNRNFLKRQNYRTKWVSGGQGLGIQQDSSLQRGMRKLYETQLGIHAHLSALIDNYTGHT